MMLLAGLRIGETVALDVDDVTMSARKGVVTIRSRKEDAYREVALNALVRAVLWAGTPAAEGRRSTSPRAGPSTPSRNDGFISPHCGGLNWPTSSDARLTVARSSSAEVGRAGSGIENGAVRADQA